MLPNNAISVVVAYAPYLSPDSADGQDSESLEQGGIAISDASQGRQVQDWRAYIETTLGVSTIKVAPFLTGTPVTTVLTGTGLITAVSLAFDSSMNTATCYIEAGVLKLHWYDTVAGAYRSDSYAGATSGKVSTDDKRSSQEGPSDVIFAYVRADVLYWRQQRDRYTVEYTVGAAVGRNLTRLGMTTKNRLQFELSQP